MNRTPRKDDAESTPYGALAGECEICAPFYLGEWWVKPSTGEIRRDAEHLRLEPRVMDVLVYMARNSERVISTREFIDNLWRETAVTDYVLWRCIATLRKALGDDSQKPTYIRTLPRRGYHLVASVHEAESEESSTRTTRPAPLVETLLEERRPQRQEPRSWFAQAVMRVVRGVLAPFEHKDQVTPR